ncbi:precorrin-3B synthase [Saccharomonospora piscinae]|nr:precorrin-3B synthase [Saccharomonospora piscinae]
MPVPRSRDSRADACPGVVATHDAADGALARVRLPGGVLTPAQAGLLAECADECGDGEIHLTSRGNLQLRGVRDASELAGRLAAAGLLPSATHERVRNVLASPLSGLAGGRCDVRALVPRLDAAICAAPGLAELPGRVLFALDDGRGDVAAERPDVGWQAVSPGASPGGTLGALLLAGQDCGLRVRCPDAVAALVRAASEFAVVRGTAWRVAELDDEARAAVREAVRPLAAGASQRPGGLARTEPPPPGPVRVADDAGDAGDAVVAAPAFGRLSAETVRRLGRRCATPLLVTPWRSLVVRGVPAAELAALGFAVDAADARARVSACVGAPACAKSRRDVRTETAAALPELGDAGAVPAHVSGCERRCGRPRGPHVDVLAEDDGYRIDGLLVGVDELAARLKGTRDTL